MNQIVTNNFFCFTLSLSLLVGSLQAQDVANRKPLAPSTTATRQSDRVTLIASNISLENAFQEVQKQTGYSFVYGGTRFHEQRRRVNLTNATLAEALSQLLTQHGISYEIMGRQIVLQMPKANTQQIADREVSGRVTDGKSGEPLPGVSVVLKVGPSRGTSRGTTTDGSGNYRLTIGDEANQTLVFSFVGYDRQEVAVGNQSALNIALKESDNSLTEVQVVAFGEQRTRDLTGSFSRIKAQDIKQNLATSPDVALQGRAAGVQITQQNGVPGAAVRINIRGVASINSNAQPLVVIDGVPANGGAYPATGSGVNQNPLAELNPNDIESMEVLKDASAAVLYGARAANGVILITTKKGVQAKPQLNFSFQEGLSTPTRLQPLFSNSRDYLDVMKRAAEQFKLSGLPVQGTLLRNITPGTVLVGLGTSVPSNLLIDSTAMYNANTNWLDQVLQNARFRQATLSIQAGNKWSTAYVSGGYRNDQSLLVGNTFRRLNTRANLSITPTKWLKAGLNLSINDNDQVAVPAFTYQQAYLNSPALPVILPSGDYFFALNYANNAVNVGRNPVFTRNNTRNNLYSTRSINNAWFNLEPVKGLVFRSELGLDYQNARNEQNQSQTLYPAELASKSRSGNGRSEYRNQITEITNIQNTLTYTREWGKQHRLTALVGQQMVNQDFRLKIYIAENIPEGEYFGKDTVSGENRADTPIYRFSSFFGRLNYVFADKYLVEASLRRDGSSRFGPGNRWGTFPSVSAGWIVSEEPWLRERVPVINFLKTRLSYGLVGNAEIGDFSWQRTFRIQGQNDAIFGGVQGARLNNAGNRDLQWEKTWQFDAGIDVQLFNGRIRSTLDYYNKNSRDLLLNYAIGNLFGTAGGNLTVNLGEVRNRGLEFSLGGDLIRRSRFQWSADFNIARNKNTVLQTYQSPFLNYPIQFFSATNVAAPGYPLGAYFLSRFAGFDPTTGNELFLERDQAHYAITGQTMPTGTTFDATINTAQLDNRFILADKTPYPMFFGGLTNTLQYGGFTLSTLVYFQSGNWLYNQGERTMSYPVTSADNLLQNIVGIGSLTEVLRQTPTNGAFPLQRLSNARTLESTRFLDNGSFVRLKNVALSYGLPNGLARRLWLRTARLTFTGQNLLLLTSFRGNDPEVNQDSSNLGPGRVDRPLPQVRSYTLGIDLGF